MSLPPNPLVPEEIFVTEDEPVEQEPAPEAPGGLTAEQLQEILANERQKNQEALRAVLQGVQPVIGKPLQDEDMFPELQIDPVGLPHPSTDLEGFIRGWQERTNAQVKQLLRQVSQKVTERAVGQAANVADIKAAANRAFDLIREAAPDLDEDLIQFAASKVAQRYQSQGIEPTQALLNNVSGVAQEVLDYADERFGAGVAAASKPLTRRGTRTGGIPGASGSRVVRAPKAADEDGGPDIIQELKDFQYNFFKSR